MCLGVPPRARPMEQPSAIYRLLQATIQLDNDSRGGGRPMADESQALYALARPPDWPRNLTPPGRGGAPQQPLPAPGLEATKPLE